MKVLVACEYSGTVRDAFIARGHDALSCDLLPTDKPGPHYQGDVFELDWRFYDLVIAHPPCTYLTISAEWAYKEEQTKKIKPGTLIGAARQKARADALAFITRMWEQPVTRLCIENPVGVINKNLPFMPKPQYVQPWWFGDDASKKTGLWTRGLPKLVPTQQAAAPRGWELVHFTAECDPDGDGWCQVRDIDPAECDCMGPCEDDVMYQEVDGVLFGSRLAEPPKMRWSNQTDSGQNKLPPSADRWKLRSVTYQGIADAMAEQWGSL